MRYVDLGFHSLVHEGTDRFVTEIEHRASWDDEDITLMTEYLTDEKIDQLTETRAGEMLEMLYIHLVYDFPGTQFSLYLYGHSVQIYADQITDGMAAHIESQAETGGTWRIYPGTKLDIEKALDEALREDRLEWI